MSSDLVFAKEHRVPVGTCRSRALILLALSATKGIAVGSIHLFDGAMQIW